MRRRSGAEIDPAFGRLLRQARSQAGKTQADVAEEIGVTAEYYGRIERGLALCSIQTLAALHRILGFDTNTVLAALGERSIQPGPSRGRVQQTPNEASGPYALFACCLRPARMRHNLTQLAVARAASCSLSMYQRMENGHVLPSVPTFARLHDCLEFDANRLLEALCVAHEPPSARYVRFGVFIAHARALAEQTVSAAARAAGCSVEDYERIETGDRLPTLNELAGLHRLLGFRADSALRRIPHQSDAFV